METRNSDAKHYFVHVQNDRSCLGPIETCYYCPEVAVLHAKTTGGVLDPQRFVILVLKSLFYMHKTTGEGCKQYCHFSLVLSALLCVLKTTDEDWNPYRLFILVQITRFFMHKTIGEVWDPYRLVILPCLTCKNHR